jgi:hypothetical protein
MFSQRSLRALIGANISAAETSLERAAQFVIVLKKQASKRQISKKRLGLTRNPGMLGWLVERALRRSFIIFVVFHNQTPPAAKRRQSSNELLKYPGCNKR